MSTDKKSSDTSKTTQMHEKSSSRIADEPASIDGGSLPPQLSRPTSLTSNETGKGASSYVETTQQKLGAIITRPTLKRELLQRPPFRFLQDIVKEIQSSTGCFENVFQSEELSAKIEGAQGKAAFLEKLIDFVSLKSGLKLKINIKKILAGQDPETTNELLQILADIAKRHTTLPSQISSRNDTEHGKNIPAPLEMSNSSFQPKTLNPEPTSNQEKTGNNESNESTSEKTKSIPENTTRMEVNSNAGGMPNFTADSHFTPDDSPQITALLVPNEMSLSPPHLSRPVSLSSKDSKAGDSSFIEITQQKLGTIITRPTLKRELLERPPFRFLQDIVKEVQAATGCFENVFQPEELTTKIDGAPAKAAFLEKLVKFVSIGTGIELKINVKKILAGQDPEKTNELLQNLADFARQRGNPPKPTSSQTSSRNETKSIAERLEPNNPPSKQKRLPSEASLNQTRIDIITNSEAKPEHGKPISEISARSQIDKPSSHSMSTAPSMKQERTPVTKDVQFQSKDVPSVAGAAPPKVQEYFNSDTKTEQLDVNAVPKGIILEGEDLKDDPDDHDEEEEEVRHGVTINPRTEEDEKKHGRLVRDILKQQEKSTPTNEASEGQTPSTERYAGIKLGRIGGKERRSSYSQQTIDMLRDNIQKVCQSVNPLGKCIDFVNEDLELMRLELEKWRQEQIVQKSRLEKEQKTTAEFLSPLQKELEKVESRIAETRGRIQKLRGNIINSDDQIKVLLERQIKS